MSLPSVGRLLLSQSDKRRDSPLETTANTRVTVPKVGLKFNAENLFNN
jgi:hypothetical protein